MVRTSAKRVAAKYLHSGDFIHWEGGIGLVRVEPGDGAVASRVLVRQAEQEAILFGLRSRWKDWSALRTPVQQLPPDALVWRMETARVPARAAG